MSRQQNRFSLFFALCAVIVASAASAEEFSVSTAQELVDKLTELNPRNKSGNVIVLQKGNYDVSSYAMPWYRGTTENPSESHISVTALRLRGATGNPRDVVIYGNGTKRLLWMDGGTLESMTISNGYTSANSTRGASGAGIYSDASHPGILTNVVITCCSANHTGSNGGAYGGAIRYGTLYNCQVIGNSAYGPSNNGNGGGTRDCTVYNSIISGNTAVNGGGSFSGNLYGCTVVGNSATYGGGVYEATVRARSVISNNTATTRGGGAYVSSTGSGAIYDSDLLFNKVVGTPAQGDVGGGAVYGYPMVSNCVIRGNAVGGSSTKSRSGGAVYDCVLRDCQVFDNFVDNGYGAAMVKGKLYDCVLSNNCMSSGTGSTLSTLRGVFAADCTLYGTSVDASGSENLVSGFERCRFLNLSTASNGKLLPGMNVMGEGGFAGPAALIGVSVDKASCRFAATNCLFAGNSGLTYLVEKRSLTGVEFVNCTFADNASKWTIRGKKDGADICAGTRFVNTAFYRNFNNSATRADFNSDGAGMTFDHCLFGASASVPEGNDVIDPVYLAAKGDIRFDAANVADPYSLQRKSPAIGQGLYQDWMASATDLKGDPRAHDASVAIGCYECWIPVPGLMLLLR